MSDLDSRIDPSTIVVPEVALLVLCGPSGSGKSTFARKHFSETEVVSSDRCRALVSDDSADQSVSGAAFSVLYEIVDKRMKVGRLAVVDATNTTANERNQLRAIAKRHNIRSIAIVFTVGLPVCLAHNAQRHSRQVPENVIREQHHKVGESVADIDAEFRGNYVTLSTVSAVSAASVKRERLASDRTQDHGPFDIVGDVHGCADELVTLLTELGYDTAAWLRNRTPITHPANRRVLFLGDLVDRGPASDRVLEIAMSMHAAGSALCIMGNHEAKLLRALRGKKVTVSHGLGETLEQLATQSADFRSQTKAFIENLDPHYVFADGQLVVAHAGLAEKYHGRSLSKVKHLALYGEATGEQDEFGFPVRYPWAQHYRGDATVVYGHTPVAASEWVNNTICIDTGCVFGGHLTALRWPERTLHSVPANKQYFVSPAFDVSSSKALAALNQ